MKIFCIRVEGGAALSLTRVGNGVSAAARVERVEEASLFGEERAAFAAISNLLPWARREGVSLQVARVVCAELEEVSDAR